MGGEQPRKAPRETALVIVQATVALGAILFLSQFVAEEITKTYCYNEPDQLTPGTRNADGCEFLDDIGFTLIQLMPALIVGGFGLASILRRRARLLWVGFALAFALLLLGAFVDPSEYPWSTGRER